MSSIETIPLITDSARSDELPPDIREIIAKFKADENSWRLYYGVKLGKKAATATLSTVISHFTQAGSLLHVAGIKSTKNHLERLKEIGDLTTHCLDPTVCAGILGYAMTQKERKVDRQTARSIPLVSTGVSLYEKGNWLVKKLQGTAGVKRKAEAQSLVDHANGGCDKARAIFVEIVCGDYKSKDAWVDGLTLLKSSHAVDYAKDKLAV
jgi:hypothetical protein